MIGEAMKLIKGVQNIDALKSLKTFLDDCKKAGFDKSEIENTRNFIIMYLFLERIGKINESGDYKND